MKSLFLSVIFPCVAAEICLRFLQNKGETRLIQRKPGRIWRWNAITEKFENLEALMSNNTALCSVNAVNDLRGKTLVVATNIRYPYIIINPNEDEISGLMGDAWTALETALKFKTIYRRARQSTAATLMNGGTHALLIATSMYSYTSSYYTYSAPLTTSSYSLFVRSDNTIATKWWYISIFSRSLWVASLAMVVCIACSIMGIHRLKEKFMCVNYKDHDDEFASPFFNFFCVLGSMSGQGFQNIPKSLSLRLIVLFCLVMGMLLQLGFSSTLTSCLMSKGNVIPLANLEDVAIKRTHTLCVRNESNAYLYFTVNESAQNEFQDKWVGLINNNCPKRSEIWTDSSSFAEKLCNPRFVYLEAPEIFLPVYHKIENNCDIIQLPDTYCSMKLAFLHARMAQHRRLIDSYLMRMRSAGILKYLEKKWILTESRADHIESNHFQPIHYAHIRISSWLFFMMVAISVFICILENIWYKLKFKKKNSNSILLTTCNNKIIKTCHRVRPKFKWNRKLNTALLSLNMKNPDFLQNVIVRINRW